MAPDFEIFWKVEIMRMILFFLPDLRMSAVGTPDLQRLLWRSLARARPGLRFRSGLRFRGLRFHSMSQNRAGDPQSLITNMGHTQAE